MAEHEGNMRLMGLAESASPAEAAAVVAALERFLRETAPAPSAGGASVDPWQKMALLEGVGHESFADVPHSWINA